MKADVVIVGAGPAGIVSSIELAKKGLQVIVIDEYFRSGGRLLGQLYEDPKAPKENRHWNGKNIAEQLTEEAHSLGVIFLNETIVWKIAEQFIVHISNEKIKEVHTKAIILATGAVEKALPIPGWTKTGVVSVGAAQTFTNLHQVKIGNKVLIVGIDPLSISVAIEMKNTGIDVVGLILPSPSIMTGEKSNPKETLEQLIRVAHLAPSKLFQIGSRFVKGKMTTFILKLLAFNLLKINGIPIYLRRVVTQINGETEVESVSIRNISVEGTLSGSEKMMYVDTVCLSGGLLPLIDISQTLNCELVDIPEVGGIVPLHNEYLQTTVEGIYVAGNITGIEGAKVAMAQGKLAALSLLKDWNLSSEEDVAKAIQSVEDARNSSPIEFLPNIKKGREYIQEKWAEYELIKERVN